jgi:hypothetical protein
MEELILPSVALTLDKESDDIWFDLPSELFQFVTYSEWNDYLGPSILCKWKSGNSSIDLRRTIGCILTPECLLENDLADDEDDYAGDLKFRMHKFSGFAAISVLFKGFRAISYKPSTENLHGLSQQSVISRPSLLTFYFVEQVSAVDVSGVRSVIYKFSSQLICSWRYILRNFPCSSMSAQNSSLDTVLLQQLDLKLHQFILAYFGDDFYSFYAQHQTSLSVENTWYSKENEELYPLDFVCKGLTASLSNTFCVVISSNPYLLNVVLNSIALVVGDSRVRICESFQSLSPHYQTQGVLTSLSDFDHIDLINNEHVFLFHERSCWINLDLLAVTEFPIIPDNFRHLRHQFIYEKESPSFSPPVNCTVLKEVNDYAALVYNMVRKVVFKNS